MSIFQHFNRDISLHHLDEEIEVMITLLTYLIYYFKGKIFGIFSGRKKTLKNTVHSKIGGFISWGKFKSSIL